MLGSWILLLLLAAGGHAAVRVEGTLPQRRALQRLLARIEKSSTGRELLASADGKVRVLFRRNAASALLDDQGETRLVSTRWAQMDASGKVPEIELDENFLTAGLPYACEVLAHELDHARSALAARKAGAEKFFYSFSDDEAHAVLVGSLVAWELGEDPQGVENLRQLLASTQAYHDASAIRFGRGEDLSLEEMSAPLPVYQARLERARRERDALKKKMHEHMTWRIWAEHFVRVHGLERARLHDVYESVDAYLTLYRRDDLPTLEASAAHLEEILAFCATPEGGTWVAQLARAPRSAFFQQFHRDVERLREKTRSHLSRAPAEAPAPAAPAAASTPPSPPRPPQISFDELGEMQRKDAMENPSHWPRS